MKWTRKNLTAEIMNGVTLDQITSQSKKWCIVAWCFIMGVLNAGTIDDDAFVDDWFAKTTLALEARILALGGTVIPMKHVGV